MLGRGNRWGALGAVLLLAAAFARPVAAQTERGYDETIADAIEEFRLQHWEEAVALFQRAHAQRPSARTHRGLGMAYFEARDYGAAREHLRAALRDGRNALTPALREHVEGLLRRIDAMVGEVHVRGVPAGAALEVDGARRAADTGPLVLLAGQHTVELQAPGHAPLVREVEVQPGARIELEFVTSADAGIAVNVVAEPGAGAKPVARDDGAGAWPWIVIGASGASLVAGGVLIALAQSDIDDVEGAERPARWQDYEATYDGTALTSGVGIAMAAVGAVGLSVGIAWALGDGGETPALQAAVTPGGASIGGRF